MLVELVVSNLGVIDQATLDLPAGMIALTGETGAGKTLLVDAINLLVGGRADPGLVKAGTAEATVDGRFTLDDEEWVLTRVVPAEGRSRGYINGRPATASALAELGARLIDMHGQHSHQSLLGVSAQRQALDLFGQVDLTKLSQSKAHMAELDAELASLGGDPRSRARELDLLRYQVRELDEAAISGPTEDAELIKSEEVLANAVEHQLAGSQALEDLLDDGAARDRLAKALGRLEGRSHFDQDVARLRDLLAELDDLCDSVRAGVGQIDTDPKTLSTLQERRHLLSQLCRKYGDDVAEVIQEHSRLAERLSQLESHDERAEALDAKRVVLAAAVAEAEAEVLKERTKAAPLLAAAIEGWLQQLAMPKARMSIGVSRQDGSEVEFQLAANPGAALQPLSKVASGGELARTMLALRSVLSDAPPILVFDEVDAGIGGEAGIAVGRALAGLGDRHQVLVVTHLPQVAAFADAHLAVIKLQGDSDTVSEITLLSGSERVTEVARMLSGQPDSEAAVQHASELLSEASDSKHKQSKAKRSKAKQSKAHKKAS